MLTSLVHPRIRCGRWARSWWEDAHFSRPPSHQVWAAGKELVGARCRSAEKETAALTASAGARIQYVLTPGRGSLSTEFETQLKVKPEFEVFLKPTAGGRGGSADSPRDLHPRRKRFRTTRASRAECV
jgi:hypothetical protein